MCGICGCSEVQENALNHVHNEADEIELITIEKNIFHANNQFAAENRKYLQQKNVFAVNFLSSPGSGKTTLLIKTIEALKLSHTITVIEGDQQTDLDAKRIRQTGVESLQINTGKGCHLDAHQIAHAILDLPLVGNSFLFIENVGNLVCPALFDLGEKLRVAILSVTEGDEKPLKYPYIFQNADLMIINKIDLLPYVDFDVSKCIQFAKEINPKIEVIELSSTSGENFTAWCQWLKNRHELGKVDSLKLIKGQS